MEKKMVRLVGDRARFALWTAVAELAAAGRITREGAPALDAALYGLAKLFASCEGSLDNDLLVSAALSEALIPVKRGRWRKDGLAYGINPAKPVAVVFKFREFRSGGGCWEKQ